MRSLCVGATRAKTEVSRTAALKPVSSSASSCAPVSGIGGGCGVDDSQIGRNACSRAGVVAGDHDDADAGAPRFANSHRCFGTRWVDHAYDTDEHEVAFERARGLRSALRGGLRAGLHLGLRTGRRTGVRPTLRFPRVERPVRHRQRAQRGIGHAVDFGDHALAQRVIERNDAGADPRPRAMAEQHARRAFGDDHPRVAMVVVDLDGRHHLALRGERYFAHARKAAFAPCSGAQLAFGHQKRGFGRVAVDFPNTIVALSQRGVAGQAAAAQCGDLFGAQRAVFQRDTGCVDTGRGRTFGFDQALGRVPHTGDPRAARRGDDALDRHLGAGQRAGLVGRDDRGATECLDRRQLLHDCAVLRHALHAKREHQRHDGRQPLGYGRHRQRHTEQQHRRDIGGAADIRQQQDGGHHYNSDHHHGDAEHAADVAHLALQRRRLFDGGRQQVGDATQLGLHACCGDYRAAASLRHHRAFEHHVQAVAQRRRLRQGGGIFQHGLALAGQRGFLHAQRSRLDQACIGADGVALAEQHHIAAHQLGTRHAQ
jgi:hypothetical protein